MTRDSNPDRHTPFMVRAPAPNIQHLRYAIVAAEHGSFRRAAEALMLRQSTLSRKIQELEHIVGVRLFERSSAGARPTRAGQHFLRSARSILEQVNTLVVSARDDKPDNAGHLAVGFGTSLSSGDLRSILMEFSSRFPGAHVELIEQPRSRLVAALRTDAMDIAVMIEGTPEQGLQSMPLWDEKNVVLLPEEHPLALLDVITWNDLKDETILLSQQDLGPDLQHLLLSHFAAHEPRPRILLQDVSRGSIKNLVSTGGGISLMTEASIGTSIAGLIYRELGNGTGTARIRHAACWKDGNDNPALANFLKLLRERYPPLGTGT